MKNNYTVHNKHIFPGGECYFVMRGTRYVPVITFDDRHRGQSLEEALKILDEK